MERLEEGVGVRVGDVRLESRVPGRVVEAKVEVLDTYTPIATEREEAKGILSANDESLAKKKKRKRTKLAVLDLNLAVLVQRLGNVVLDRNLQLLLPSSAPFPLTPEPRLTHPPALPLLLRRAGHAVPRSLELAGRLRVPYEIDLADGREDGRGDGTVGVEEW